ncbi:serine protease [Photobacterium sp. GB-27]|nr:serine protease [Photobacterium sp. GB-27]PSV40826.1 serine protease [Photobacterium sp. GB-210]PSV48079.1 serine protease [Photobacterium sp. GB-36]PSV55177.1 serine protease [Photobacterium sp. GB-1]PSW75273.1 serine protease [Photobacterium sp. GB-50]
MVKIMQKMVFYIVLLFLSAQSFSQPVKKVLNGSDVDLFDSFLLPWNAALISKNNDSIICGAVVIAEHWLLTVAHCNNDNLGNVAIVGAHSVDVDNLVLLHDRYKFNIVDKISHPDYDPLTFLNDIALLRVDRSLFEVSQAIKIATVNEQYIVDEQFRNSWATNIDSSSTTIASGWGDTVSKGYPSILQVVTLAGVPDEQCIGLTDNHDYIVCADSNINGLIKDVCNGDSGNPLIWQNEQTMSDSDKGVRLIGLASNGAICINRNNFPENQYNQLTGQYTQVSSYKLWIEDCVTKHHGYQDFTLNDNNLKPTIDIDPFVSIPDYPQERTSPEPEPEKEIVTTDSSGGLVSWYFILIILVVTWIDKLILLKN